MCSVSILWIASSAASRRACASAPARAIERAVETRICHDIRATDAQFRCIIAAFQQEIADSAGQTACAM
jgi:hypothetical protein